MERRRSGGEGERVLGAEVLGEAPLELGRAGPGREPARAQRLGDGRDLLLADRGRLEAEERLRVSRALSDALRASIGDARRTARRPRRRARAPLAGVAAREHRARPVGAAAKRPEHAARAAGRRAPSDALERLRLLDARRRLERARAATRKRTQAPPAAPRAERASATRSPSAAARASAFRSTPSAAAQSSASCPPPRRAASSTTRGPSSPTRTCVYVGPSRPRAPRLPPRRLDGRGDRLRGERARPDVRERDAERRGLGDEAVGDGQRVEAALDREGVHRHLAALRRAPRRAPSPPCATRERARTRRAELVARRDDREAALPLPVGRLHDAREAEPLARLDVLGERHELASGLRHACLGESLALAAASRSRAPRRRDERVRQPEALRDPRGHRHGPVDPGGDDPVDALGAGEPVDRFLVLGRDDRAPVGDTKPDARRVPVGGDDEEPALAGRASSPSCAGPAPRTRRRFGGVAGPRRHQASFSRYQVIVCSSPSLERRARTPAEQPLGLVGRADVPVDLAEPLGHVRFSDAACRARRARVGDVGHRDVDPGRDVEHLARDARRRRPR